jgi:hypothetical protein
MSIVFYCQSCGARFEVNAGLGGKKGLCKKCGQLMEIPRAEHLASMVAMPALAAAGAGAAVAPGAGGNAPSLSNWLKASATNIRLAPITAEQMPAVKRRALPTPLDDDLGDSKPYAVAAPEVRIPGGRGAVARATGSVLSLWRREWGVVQRIFRWLNEGAYFISIPFLVILLIGIVFKNRNLAIFGATYVVLLNIGRIVAGAANLSVIPLRSGINVKKMRKPFRRVVEPVLTIGAVVLAFTFVPWLSEGRSARGSITDRLRQSAKGLTKEMEGGLKQAADKAQAVDVGKLGAQAVEKLNMYGAKLGEQGPTASQAGDTAKSPQDAIGGLIKDVGQRVSKTVEEYQKQP